MSLSSTITAAIQGTRTGPSSEASLHALLDSMEAELDAYSRSIPYDPISTTVTEIKNKVALKRAELTAQAVRNWLDSLAAAEGQAIANAMIAWLSEHNTGIYQSGTLMVTVGSATIPVMPLGDGGIARTIYVD